ncbi:MAG: hypothetical protein R2712_04045 [Vicinamibacterales bacterium]
MQHLRHDRIRQPFLPPPEAAGASGEDPRIEQLLVSGLDHYRRRA